MSCVRGWHSCVSFSALVYDVNLLWFVIVVVSSSFTVLYYVNCIFVSCVVEMYYVITGIRPHI